MNHLIIDGFLEFPKDEREKALEQKYETIQRMGFNYPGISLTDDYQSKAEVSNISDLIGEKLTPHVSMYRRYTEEELGPTYIHSDLHLAHYTAILFLNKSHQCDGGTAFWKHKQHGWESHPTEKQVRACGLEPTKELFAQLHQDGFDETKWELVELADMKFNRLLVFSAPKFHSRYPFKPFGDKTLNARLIKVYFMVRDGVHDPIIR